MKPLRIVHSADLHIFFMKRHEEHQEIISNFISIVKEIKPDLVYFGGDLQDSKSKLSAEQIDLINFFLYEISSICPIIMILGNHDTNLQNKQRLDSLTPLVNNINSIYPIYYLKDSGVYNLYNIDWVVWSRFDNLDPMEGFRKKNYTIGCYHGPIIGARSDHGYDKLQADLSVETFNQCDTVFLGDIHLQQFFRNNEIAYSGSMLQVNIGETEDKGFLLWEWNDSKYIPKHISLSNRFGYRSYEIENLNTFDLNKVNLTTPEQICRLIYTGDETSYSYTKLNELKKKIGEKYPNQVLLQKRFSKRKSVNQEKVVKSIDYFTDYFKNKGINQTVIEELQNLDKHYNSLVPLIEYQGSEYFIKEIEIHNFLCYGEHNVLSLEEIKGLIGLFAKNGSGKSSFFDAIMFCLFNKTPKDSGAKIKLINDQLDVDRCYVQIKLLIEGITWTIRRSIISNKEKNGATVKLEVYEEAIARHLESRPQTDKQVLQPLLGDESIFLMTVLSSQKNSTEFIDSDNAKRLDLTIRFLGILLYDAKFKLIDKDLKQEETIRAVLNTELEKLISKQELEKKLKEFKAFNSIKESILKKLIKVIAKRKDLLKIALTKKDELNAVNVLQTEEELKKKLVFYKKHLEENEIKKKNFINTIWTEQTSLEEWHYKRTEQKDLIELAELNADIKSLEAQIKKDIITICPNCNHEWHTTNLEELKASLIYKKEQRDILDIAIKDKEQEQNRLDKIKKTILQEKQDYEEILKNIKTNTSNIEIIENQIIIINENKEKLEQKKQLDFEIEILEEKLEENRNTKSSYEIFIAEKKQQIISLQENIKIYQEKIKQLEEKDNLINNLQLYKDAMHRTGIPFLILKNFIPLINFEVNSYISELFDFTVEFELDESSLNINYTKENLLKLVKRDVAQACGQESTIVNLAIRAALSKISLLPKPSLLLLDELFSMLDPVNLEKMNELIHKLKDQYQNIILITHTEEIKDWPEHFINLQSNSGVTSII